MVEAGRDKSRAGAVIRWIEEHCRVPSGMRKGDRVRLSPEQRQRLVEIYNAPDAPLPVQVIGELGAYLALLHTCGIEAPGNGPMPDVAIDPWTVWNAAGPTLLEVVKREGESITCPALGTRYPRRAA